LEPRRGRLRKARNLVQVDAHGDARVGGITGNTLKAKRRAQQSRASGCEELVGERHERMTSGIDPGNTVVELVPGKGENPKRGAAAEEV
jgi:hypothetical protein